MKVSEFKLKVVNGINGLIDDYFGGNDIKEKLINSTLKIIVKQNQHKYDYLLDIFTDEKGEINISSIIDEYSKIIGDDGLVLDIRDFIKNEWLKGTLPNKALKIKKEDVINMLT